MTKFKNKYRIESNRWKYWDYSAPGRYFLTVCSQNRACTFGNVVHGEMKLSSPGKIVKSEIEKIPTYHKRIILHEWVIMPNHIHLIIELGDYHFENGMNNEADNERGGAWDNVEKIHEFSLPRPQPCPRSTPSTSSPHRQQWWHILNYQPTNDEIKQYRKFRRKMIIPKIMGRMKMVTSKHINILHNTPCKKNWQKDYHDHIIHENKSYHNISNYIINNPMKWQEDTFNPKKTNSDL